MSKKFENWNTQIRKGYLELCILLVIQRESEVYGFDLLEKLIAIDLPVKEGTLYPLLNRMTTDGVLKANWQTNQVKGHPRKFYSLTLEGVQMIKEMNKVFINMTNIHKQLNKTGEDKCKTIQL